MGLQPAGHGAITVAADDHAILSSLGDDLKFVFITSAIELVAGDATVCGVSTKCTQKCERCWHYRDDVGHDPEHPTPVRPLHQQPVRRR